MKKSKNKIQVLAQIVVLSFLISTCNRKTDTMDFGSAIENNKIVIYKNGVPRLNGGIPVFQNKNFSITGVSVSGKDSTQTISFTTSNSIQPIEIHIDAYPNSSTLIFSLTPNKNQSINGDDYISLMFGSIPGFDIGTSFFKYGSVKAWTYPQKISSIDSLKHTDNQFFYWKYSDSLYAAMMPLGGEGYMSTIGTDSNQHFGTKAKVLVDNFDSKRIPLMAIAFDKNPFQLFEKIYDKGLSKIGKESSLRKNKKYPAFFEKMMWCTWNSFMHDVDEKRIFEGLESFKAKGFKLPLLLIDDGWSQVTAYGTGRLKSFEVEPKKFPKGLANTVKIAKEKYGVEQVGVWHAFNGYWAGVDMESDLGKSQAQNLIAYKDKVAWTDKPIETFYGPTPKSDAGFAFYDQWYTYLKKEGIAFVKVDNQLIANRICKKNAPFSEGAAQLQKNIQNAVKKHFDGNVVNCMDMTTDAVYNYQNSPIARSSEDFFPENQSFKIESGNAAIHVLCNVYNSVWWSQMVYPDFDMFQSHHPQAEYHAIARAISGGPIYITDTPSKQNFDIVNKLMYKNGTIIRADIPAMPTEDCLFSIQDSKPLKVFSVSNGVGLLGVFNPIDAQKVEGTISPSDIYGFSDSKYIIYDTKNKTIQKADLNQKIPVSISKLEANLFYILPFSEKIAPIGLIDKYNAPKTIKKVDFNDTFTKIELFEAGDFAAYLPQKPSKVLDSNNKEITFSYSNQLLLINTKDITFKVYF